MPPAKPPSFAIKPRDVAMDLGTANTLIHLRGRGIVVNEPTVIAWQEDGRVLAVGARARSYLGKNPPNIKVTRPLKDGVIEDFTRAQALIRAFLAKVQPARHLMKPRAVVSVPAGVTQVEKRAIVNAATSAGMGKIHLVDEPMAAAIGAGLDVADRRGRLVVDIGGGTTEVALISQMGTVAGETVRVAGDEMNEAIVFHLRHHHRLEVGEATAETVKMGYASALEEDDGRPVVAIAGRDLESGTPAQKEIPVAELRLALAEPLAAIVEAVETVIDAAPAELLDHVRADGILMAGGGALLQGLDRYLAAMVGIPCRCSRDPLTTVVEGGARILDDLRRYQPVFLN